MTEPSRRDRASAYRSTLALLLERLVMAGAALLLAFLAALVQQLTTDVNRVQDQVGTVVPEIRTQVGTAVDELGADLGDQLEQLEQPIPRVVVETKPGPVGPAGPSSTVTVTPAAPAPAPARQRPPTAARATPAPAPTPAPTAAPCPYKPPLAGALCPR